MKIRVSDTGASYAKVTVTVRKAKSVNRCADVEGSNCYVSTL